MATLVVGVSAASFCAQEPSLAGDAKAGREKVEQVCAVCHGDDGVGKIAEAPNLAGQNEGYLIAQLTAFKSGARANDTMTVIAKDLSQSDIENVAAFYAAIPVTVGKPPQ